MRASSWSLETRRLYLRYIVAGVFAIPAGVVYGALQVNGIDSRWVVVSILSAGLALAAVGWIASDRLLRLAPTPIALQMAVESHNVNGQLNGMRFASAAALAASLAVMCTQLPQMNSDGARFPQGGGLEPPAEAAGPAQNMLALQR